MAIQVTNKTLTAIDIDGGTLHWCNYRYSFRCWTYVVVDDGAGGTNIKMAAVMQLQTYIEF